MGSKKYHRIEKIVLITTLASWRCFNLLLLFTLSFNKKFGGCHASMTKPTTLTCGTPQLGITEVSLFCREFSVKIEKFDQDIHLDVIVVEDSSCRGFITVAYANHIQRRHSYLSPFHPLLLLVKTLEHPHFYRRSLQLKAL